MVDHETAVKNLFDDLKRKIDIERNYDISWDDQIFELLTDFKKKNDELTKSVEELSMWRDAIHDDLIVSWVYNDENSKDAYKAMRDLINYNICVESELALDSVVLKYEFLNDKIKEINSFLNDHKHDEENNKKFMALIDRYKTIYKGKTKDALLT